MVSAELFAAELQLSEMLLVVEVISSLAAATVSACAWTLSVTVTIEATWLLQASVSSAMRFSKSAEHFLLSPSLEANEATDPASASSSSWALPAGTSICPSLPADFTLSSSFLTRFTSPPARISEASQEARSIRTEKPANHQMNDFDDASPRSAAMRSEDESWPSTSSIFADSVSSPDAADSAVWASPSRRAGYSDFETRWSNFSAESERIWLVPAADDLKRAEDFAKSEAALSASAWLLAA